MDPLWDALPSLEVPVTLAVGERDEKFRAIAERMAAVLPRAEIAVVEGAGHAAQLEAAWRGRRVAVAPANVNGGWVGRVRGARSAPIGVEEWIQLT